MKTQKGQVRYGGQATIEFAFAMVIIALLIFGLIKIFRWAGMDYAQKAYEQRASAIFINGTTALDMRNAVRSRLTGYSHGL